MKLNFAYILLIIVTISSIGCNKTIEPSDNQADKFTKIFGNYGEDNASEVYQTNDGGYILVGTVSTHTYGKDIAVIKTDKFGNEEWSKTYGDTLDNFGNSIKTVGNDFIVLGTTTDTTLTTNMYLLKIDGSGNKIWDRSIGPKASDEEGANIQTTSDNGFVLVGSSTAEDKIIGPGGNDSIKNALGVKDFYLVKTDQNGDVIWSENYGANQNEYGNKVIVTNSGYVVLGSSNSFEETGYKNSSILGIVINQNGAISGGFNLFGGAKNDFGYQIEQVSDGFIIAGTTSSFSSSGTDIYVAKVNSTLTSIIWETNVGSTGNESGNTLYIDGTTEDIYVGGYTDDASITNGERDQYLVRLTKDGILDDTWSGVFGGSGNDAINFIQPTSDDGFIFIGTTEFESNQMINLVKLDSEGKLGNN